MYSPSHQASGEVMPDESTVTPRSASFPCHSSAFIAYDLSYRQRRQMVKGAVGADTKASGKQNTKREQRTAHATSRYDSGACGL
jgi:hypothetical protein